jgi:hypothetical protein
VGDSEAVWDLAEHRAVFIEVAPEHAGQARALPVAYLTQALRGRPPTATGDLPGAVALPATTVASAVNANGLDE